MSMISVMPVRPCLSPATLERAYRVRLRLSRRVSLRCGLGGARSEGAGDYHNADDDLLPEMQW